jgi:hypothetical protein
MEKQIVDIFGSKDILTSHKAKDGSASRPMRPLSENKVKYNDEWVSATTYTLS